LKDLIEEKSKLPKVESVKFQGFDLYKNESSFEVPLQKSVNCLIGANGLGKSSFLNAVMFAITGCVPANPRKFKSAQEYFKTASKFDRTNDYFSGRISEESRPNASVGVTLVFGSTSIFIERLIFSEDNINELRICENGNDWEVLSTDRYTETIRRVSNLSYPLFVFLLHFVSLFDEERHLLMWDDEALTSALFIAFGSSAEFAEQYETLNRKFQRADSKARNARYGAQQEEKRLAEIDETFNPSTGLSAQEIERINAKAEGLRDESDTLQDRLQSKETELRDVELKWFDLTSELSELELEYRNLFNERLQKNSRVSFHPTISNSIEGDECAICGSIDVAKGINDYLAKNQCPLCESSIDDAQDKDDELLEKLKRIDIQIGETRDEMDVIFKQRDRLKYEVSEVRERYLSVEEDYNSFISRNSEHINSMLHTSNLEGNLLQEKIRKIKKSRQGFIEDSEKYYKERDEYRNLIKKYENSLQKSYELGAESFVPRFRELSESFIGLPIDVELEKKKGKTKVGFGLKLRMKDQLRLSPERLSESQRFFIDIALRMSLLEVLSNTPTSIFVDTPEGSLDIAYEARAGDMFSNFTSHENSILMTANLRSSELVLRLAERKRLTGMQVIRMTEWTELSDVQRAEEELFTKAYEEVDKTLRAENES